MILCVGLGLSQTLEARQDAEFCDLTEWKAWYGLGVDGMIRTHITISLRLDQWWIFFFMAWVNCGMGL